MFFLHKSYLIVSYIYVCGCLMHQKVYNHYLYSSLLKYIKWKLTHPSTLSRLTTKNKQFAYYKSLKTGKFTTLLKTVEAIPICKRKEMINSTKLQTNSPTIQYRRNFRKSSPHNRLTCYISRMRKSTL